MKHIITFSGSNSKASINKQLAVYAASLVEGVKVTVLDLNDFNLPIYGADIETTNGIPDNAHNFFNYIKASDGIILSLAEHNGSYTSVFKNIFDWMSRIDKEVFQNRPMLLMATSPGARGGKGVFEAAKASFPHLGGNIVAQFSLPSFYDNFTGGQVYNQEFRDQLVTEITAFKDAL